MYPNGMGAPGGERQPFIYLRVEGKETSYKHGASRTSLKHGPSCFGEAEKVQRQEKGKTLVMRGHLKSGEAESRPLGSRLPLAQTTSFVLCFLDPETQLL